MFCQPQMAEAQNTVLSTPRPGASRKAAELRLSLLNGFRLSHGERRVDLPASARRLLAFLAVGGRPLQRTYVAGTLWMDQPEDRSAGNLRSALWRLQHCQRGLVESERDSLCLASDLRVDLHELSAAARRLVNETPAQADLALDVNSLAADLLPDWYEDWVTLERERFRQLRLHALEALCRWHSRDGRHAQAILAGIEAVAAEPLRESAQRALIEAYAKEGNCSEALRQFGSYRQLLRDELGLEPTPDMQGVLSTLLGPAS